MLLGEYTHTIDDKNRISLPAKFRNLLGKKLIITPGLEECLFVFSAKEWSRVKNKLSNSDSDLSFLSADRRSFNRFMFGRAAEVEVDSVGRILLPPFLKEKIKLLDSAVVVGVEDRLEIWQTKAWEKYKLESEKQISALAEKLAKV